MKKNREIDKEKEGRSKAERQRKITQALGNWGRRQEEKKGETETRTEQNKTTTIKNP